MDVRFTDSRACTVYTVDSCCTLYDSSTWWGYSDRYFDENVKTDAAYVTDKKQSKYVTYYQYK
jgi:hypothetical protein